MDRYNPKGELRPGMIARVALVKRQLEGVIAGLRREMENADEARTKEIETRIDTEVADLRHACALAHDIIATGLSNEAITPRCARKSAA